MADFLYKALIIFCLVLSSCQYKAAHDLKTAKNLAESGDFLDALQKFDQIISRQKEDSIELEATREAARISFYETKNFEKAAKYYEKIVLISQDTQERLQAQKQVASVYFEHLSNYPKAIVEINKILPLVRDNEEKLKYKMDLARAYYYQNNFFQAEMEADEFLRISKNDDQNFQMKILKANIVLARKDTNRAATLLQEVMSNNPQKAKKENVGLTLAVAYEEMKEYKKAIEVLEDLKTTGLDTDYVKLRIKRLKERLANQPGARGMRK